MTCMAFYKSVYEVGCKGIGESCEKCVPLIEHPYLLLLVVGITGLMLLVASLFLMRYGGEPK